MEETTVGKFFRGLLKYQERARDRFPEYLDTHAADATFGERTLYEFMIDISDRMEKIEQFMTPADEEVKDAEADALKR
jgi:hypothetical protein